MNITTIGRGNIGGGLAQLWEEAGHTITALGRDGGDASDADAVLVAVPSGSISEVLGKVSGLEGKLAIDAKQRVPRPERGLRIVRPRGEGPHERADREGVQGELRRALRPDRRAAVRPGQLYAADDEAREITEQLIRDAGFEPVSVDGLEQARALEDFVPGLLGKIGRVFYRFAPPASCEEGAPPVRLDLPLLRVDPEEPDCLYVNAVSVSGSKK